jgi:hypothetical protein
MMQLTANAMRATLEQMSADTPLTAAIRTVEQLMEDYKDDAWGVQKINKT